MIKFKVLSKEDISNVLEMQQVIEVVENVYKSKNSDMTEVWPTIFHDFVKGKADMDIKSGYLKDEKIFGHKTVTWFGENIDKGLPTLIGLLAVYDSETGVPLGVMDASYITGIRTGAAGAIGAKYLAKKEADTLLIVGAGNQSVFQIAATLTTLPNIKRVNVASRVYDDAVKFIKVISERLKIEFDIDTEHVDFEAVIDLETAVKESHIIITVTPSRKPIIKKEWIQKGTHISCIGADMEGKQEIDSEIMAFSTVFVDDYEHCKQVGEIEMALQLGHISEDDIVGEIGELILGQKPGRTSDDQITIFDATGMALLDIATARLALKLSDEKDLGSVVNF